MRRQRDFRHASFAQPSAAQVSAFPELYASRRNGCAIPTQGYAAHGEPVENEEISFSLQSGSASDAVTFWEAGETYTLEVSAGSGESVYAWVHASAGIVTAALEGEQASACPNAWHSDTGAAVHTVQWDAPAAVGEEGLCVIFSTAQAGGSRAAYSTNSVRFNF